MTHLEKLKKLMDEFKVSYLESKFDYNEEKQSRIELLTNPEGDSWAKAFFFFHSDGSFKEFLTFEV